ncbi:MAG: MATE family efflux transporter [Lachnospiraceae bacterium]|nr:MATE family efflux transporter [Lachnospiraceae bacterium]
MTKEATTAANGVSSGENILGTKPIPELLLKFAVPSVISMLVNSIYNLVDQIFIGQGVGYLGNAATNVVFPFVMISMAVSLMISVGTAANVGLNLGKGDQDQANRILGNGLFLALISGFVILIFGEGFMVPLLRLFGATDNILPYAIDYGRIYLVGTVFTTIGILLNDIIRADGNPSYSMRAMLLGAGINIVLDPLFIFVFHWGVQGAALATILGQLATLICGLLYLKKLRTLQMKKENMKLKGDVVKSIVTLGLSSFFTQFAALFMQIIMNQQTIKYGEMSIYGADIPLTVFGIVNKVNGLMMSLIMGISTGSQPLFSFNYGAKKFQRVKQLVKTAMISCVVIGFIGMLCLQSFPNQIISIFGQESDLYNEFAVMCLKNMTIFIFVMGVQMVAGVYYQAVGKPVGALLLSLSRQVLFMIPCFLILPIFFGIKGVMWSFPVSDVLSVAMAALMLAVEMRKLNQMIREDGSVQAQA